MPVVLDAGSDEMRTWLDPARHEWDGALQSLLRPFDGALDVYPVSKDVGKVGNNSPAFVVPLDSKENKSNIANLFAKAQLKAPKHAAEPAAEDAAHGDEEPPRSPARKRKAPPARIGSPPETTAAQRRRVSATQTERKTAAKAKAPGASQKITSFFGSAT